MRIRALLSAALVTASLVACQATAATAAPHRDNVLRGFCAATVKTSCVQVLDNDEGDFTVRDRAGRFVTFTTSRNALSYLRHHAPKCKQEDSTRCYWDAGHRGNRTGDSFVSVGKIDTLFYLGNLD